MAVEIFGVTEAKIEANLPMVQIDSATGTLLTSARLTILIEQAAAQINAYIEAGCGAGSVVTFAADTTTYTYANATRGIIAAASILVVTATSHVFAASIEGQQWIEGQREIVAEFRSDVARALGVTGDNSTISSVHGRMQTLDLSQSTTAKMGRRIFDGQNPLTGAKEHGFEF